MERFEFVAFKVVWREQVQVGMVSVGCLYRYQVTGTRYRAVLMTIMRKGA